MAFLLWPPLAPLYTIDNYILVAAVAVKCHVSSHILVSFVGTVPLPRVLQRPGPHMREGAAAVCRLLGFCVQLLFPET